MWKPGAFIIISLCFVKAQIHLIDSRCYLAEGGSAENFLASEDAAVGSVLGTLGINGDPKTDISLSLREKDSPISIAPLSKNIILSKPLDKEGVEGPASVYVNVICDRRMSNDPSFLIPVNIRVTDVNDNSPAWIGAPYVVNISEVTIVGTRILQGIRALDMDQPGPYSTIEYQVLPGPQSKYVAFISPLEGTLVLKHELDYETLRNFTVVLRAQDQGVPPKYSDTTLTIFVLDADDQNPKFFQDVYHGTFQGNVVPSEIKFHTEPIKAIDQDSGLNASLTYSIVPSSHSTYFTIDSKTAALRLTKQLNISNPITLVVKATQLDNNDRYALSTVILSQLQSTAVSTIDKVSFMHSIYRLKIKENYNPGNTILKLIKGSMAWNVNLRILNDTELYWFSIDRNGDVKLSRWLDYETQPTHKFTVELNDGSNKEYAEVLVEVLDVNDWEPRFRKPHYTFKVRNRNFSTPLALGKVEAADGDVRDKITYSLRGDHANLFYIDSGGTVWLKYDVPDKMSFKLHLIATDTGFPPKSTSVPLSIEFDEVNESPIKWTTTTIGALTGVTVLCVLACLAVLTYFCRSSVNRTNRNVPMLISRSKATNKTSNIGIITANTRGSNSSISASASTIIAASLERDQDSYTTTIRDIVNRAQQPHKTVVRSSDMEQDSLTNSETGFHCSYPTTTQSGASWHQRSCMLGEKAPNDNDTNGENKLTVYF
ncbi:protocadherin Fat 4 [Aedes albopictus]|uniref:Cadherin domain-containing protein n=1 Tax=Aedes albopictus TaxID=7160 RepID=A0ABM1XPG0_AEDAL